MCGVDGAAPAPGDVAIRALGPGDAAGCDAIVASLDDHVTVRSFAPGPASTDAASVNEPPTCKFEITFGVTVTT